MHIAREIENLKKRLLALSAMVEESFERSVLALNRMDGTLARQVIGGDVVVDQTEVDIEEECLKVLALHQPVANDLRFIVSILKINNDLERIADLAVNIAERVIDLQQMERTPPPFDFVTMSAKVHDMVKKGLDSLVNLDPHLAREVISLDDEVDQMHHETYGLVIEQIKQHPDRIHGLICYLVISRYLERIADQTTNIAEDTLYLVEGKIVRHQL
ncbi:MAG: phosphate signaling complex protein PhoU [Syntrophotalea acetylenica]|jgi:phosphate transport system protein|uniref:Phosphate-specific transport system accessory protein PhoU n=1 Tax=Syntrophotalea acetylenica TaxID=29542 RepID=A0A1L3GE54_SYNAC|nr:phosphate signaling complex protein PhoU [Syntrophotalea acetylenica]APG24230.1 phosphate transport system regulatory protein PhoU [Syntrophotalea acetylenica]APG44811.1 phosphate transport system regulatory protein PhoU [Syntrophotalea acetylenica]MDD4456250.1 phosphate signaling complex protein PhoU [Syntrophotalea acetylenica]MDY0261806.1 phosphate signaling complex protein PhoU [Syntrophotalea acetylenica]